MKHKLRLTLFVSFLFFTALLFAQKQISGTVTSAGTPIPGANVVVQGTSNGVETDFDGKYYINASQGDILTFSFVGMITQNITVGSSNTIDVVFEEDAQTLDEVIVTALGIKKTRKSLTYAAQDVKSEELSRVKQTNPINSLSGKVSGIAVTKSASGVGGSVKVTIRGNSSLADNQPLYVVDGIPLSNPTASQPTSVFGSFQGGNRDGGDALSLLNPDDIESLSVLKGASASALYGSAGLNGVILITTKKGKTGGFKVNYSSNITVDEAAYMMNFNDKTQANIDDFFNTGHTLINAISISGGNENAQTYFSYANTYSSGIMPTNELNQHTISLRETSKLNEKLTLNANVMASTQKIHNRPVSGLYFNPLVGVYNFASDTETLSDYSTYEEWDNERYLMKQRWFRDTSDIEQNPYWMINRNASDDTNKKLLTSLNLNYKVNDWLSLQTRGTYDKSMIGFDKKVYATTNLTLAPENGRYIVKNNDVTKLFGDLIANINTKINDNLSVNGLVGTSYTDTKFEDFIGDSGVQGGLQYANVFAFNNFTGGAGTDISQNSHQLREYSTFSSATINYKNSIYVDLTERLDWSSSLLEESNPVQYPSVGVTGILSELFELGEQVSFAKLRTSYAEVGHAFGPDLINPNKVIIFGSGVSGEIPPSAFPGTSPRPERQKSFEIGTEWKFSNNKYGIDLGYYHTSTVDQYFLVPISAALYGAPNAYFNSGNILNEGFEAFAFAKVIQQDDLGWVTSLNFAKNKNTIEKLVDLDIEGVISFNSFPIDSPGPTNSFGSFLVEGGSFGDIYGKVVKRNENGLPIVELNDADEFESIVAQDDNDDVPIFELIGNCNPDFTLGWNNSFTFKNITLNFLIDGKFGGTVVNMTEGIIEGKSNNSARETENAMIDVVTTDGVAMQVSAQDYYGKAGGRAGFTGEYTYDATNIRLADLSIGYKFNIPENSFFKNIKASFVGNNLFFLYKEVPYDPNVTLSTGNNLQGVDVLGLPSTRSMGLNINLTF